MDMPDRTESTVDRRTALAMLGGLGLGVLGAGSLAACSTGSSEAITPSTTSQGTADCTLTPEVTEGPYYLDIDKVRSDITEGKPGVPLDLRITVVDADGCTPVKDAAVDVWHCDAEGVYSGVGQGGRSPTFLRGTQVSDRDGLVRFATIYPGWYPGRAVHIHTKVHAGGSVVHTGQLFFDDDLTDKVYLQPPYDARAPRDVHNSQDSIYRNAGGASAVLTMQPAGHGYTGAITVGVTSQETMSAPSPP